MFHANSELRMIQQKSQEQGLSLIEVLISFSLIIFLVLNLAQITLHTLLLKKKSEASLWSAQLAADKMKVLKSHAFQNLLSIGHAGTDTCTRPGSKETYERSWKINPGQDGLLRIEVECRSLSNPRNKTGVALLCSSALGF